MESKTIALIGGTGNMGEVFAEALSKAGHKLLITGRSTKLSNVEATKQADIVIITVPIRETEKVIKEIASYVRKGALLSDFTSVKKIPCDAMLSYSSSEVIGCHPLFGPSIGLAGQEIVLSPVRGEKHIKEYRNLWESIGLRVTIMSPEEHDKLMALIQSLNHLSNTAFVNVVKKHSPTLPLEHATPAFLSRLYSIARACTQNPELYADLILYNPYTLEMMKELELSTSMLKKAIESKNEKALVSCLEEIRNYCSSIMNEARVLTDKLVKEARRKNE